ncbi:MAG: helix-turn-helix transcriptional regulator [Actinomycetota bacterium]|nr:helix-turn-helix transcriptional regulator [Actinomycetota bacterium]
MSASSFLRSARGGAGVSQRQLALDSRVTQPAIAVIESGSHDTSVSRLEQLLASLGQRVVLLPTLARPVSEAADALRAALLSHNYEWAWREVIQTSDDLAGVDPAVRVALAVTRPLPVGDRRYDALLAALVDYWMSLDRLPRPMWLDDPHYSLNEPWDIEELESLRARARLATPRSIRRHGVFLDPTQLLSA